MSKKDSSALDEFIKLMSNRFHREAFEFLKNKEEAEEAVNTVFEKLWRKANLYNFNRPPLPYVISVLRNYCRDMLRKKSRRINCVSLDSSKRTIKIREQSSTDSILDEVLQDKVVNEIAKLHYISGFSVPKIALLKRLSSMKIEEYLAEARAILIPYLKDQCSLDPLKDPTNSSVT